MIEIFNNSGENSSGKIRSETHKIYGLSFDNTDLSIADPFKLTTTSAV